MSIAIRSVNELPDSTPAAPGPPQARGLFDLVLRDPAALDALVLDEVRLPATLQRLLVLSLAGLLVFGAVVGLTAQLCLASGTAATSLGRLPLLTLPVALSGAFLLALAVCLPSFYFFTQLSGLDASFRLVTAQALRVMARTSVLLLGAAPFYAAFGLSRAVGVDVQPDTLLLIGLGLPFVVGLFGIKALYRSFRDLLRVLPITHERRGTFLLRLVLAWGAVYSMVAPVALYRFMVALGRIL
jgi:hypothetical protein